MPANAPSHLRVEHLDEPLGIRVTAPRLSWRLPTGAADQQAYRITADTGWDTGWVESGQTLLVPYAGPPLTSAQRVQWRVQVRTDLGESEPSELGLFETGLLWAEDWQAVWIEPGEMPAGVPGARPAALLRYEFDVDRPVVSARLHATAQGLYEAFVNGQRAGDAELTPGWTQYDVRLQVQTIDVTGAVQVGRNALAVVLSDGWFRGQIGIVRAADQWGDRLAFLGQLHLTHDDGSVTVVGTGPGWASSTGHVLAADLIAGEQVDLRRLPRGWDTAGFADGWAPVTVVHHGYAGLVDSPAPPVRRVEELRPVSVTRLSTGAQLVDLGQGVNGWVRVTDLGPAGTTLTLTHGEWLGPDGDLTTDHLRPAVPFLPEPLPAGQVDRVVSAGVPGDVFEPRHTTHGFRYVRIEGHPGELTADDVRGVVVHTDLRRTGWFSSSDERIDRLHEAAVWSFRDNACDVPTDCPHRERAGWTGDWQLFVPTAAFLYDVAGFSTKWLWDVAADQWPDGTIANISPSARSEGREGPVAFLNGSAGWGDAVVIVPWELYRSYGDTAVLAELWPAMTRWLDRVERMARDQRHPARAAARPEPAPHERFLWDTGFHWGEWLVPGEDVGDFGAFVAADEGEVATAYYAHSAGLMARIAEVLGRPADADRYAGLAAEVRAAWQAEYLDDDGRLVPDTQADHVRALAFDLVPADLRPAVAERLVELVRKADTHLGTGFLATPYLLPVLADAGHLDVAYELLLSDTEPSWLTMIDRGATTVWERWDGVDADGVPHESLNHYSKGAVVSFLHRYTAGIELVEPAYRRFRVHPRPGGGLTSAEAAHESPYGRIESTWRVVDGRLRLRVVVPAGTEAAVVLPDGTTHSAGPGEHSYTSTLPEENAR
ncbi:family 78 glycoside hydrolase catalytic domain [Modestobacter muralis]|uniref:alpha-L-rhamnosidase n=1 Tax=Modestobacter muralis TaxID=1608614 RepID=A0A6P0H9C6_9ACTN|nr:family 78 glycoside hydrolase catalytic domain [Modestobacter muralis]NEK95332.1 family 78 glycoside hydrolase catalytic domain [Modestobacter muralis]NEN52220.1 family 78 glycoside hydrolase catalytic domain [Modestobacter muralis]